MCASHGERGLAVAGALAFCFQPGESALHRFDPRLKTVSLLLLSPSIMASLPAGLAVFSFALVAFTGRAGLDWKAAVYNLRYFGFLLAAVFLSRAIFTPGKPVLVLGPVAFTDLGVFSGALFCWRLILVTTTGLIYAATTHSREIRAAVEWLLSPVPWIPEKRVGVMVGLVVRLIPMILDQAGKTISAQKARCVECRKNPYYRLTHFALPMLRQIIKRADQLALALAARCYNESGTPPAMIIRPVDWWGAGAVLVLCLIMIRAVFIP
ncbi:MAG: hypothetical protein DSY90_04405 [Deltaproteobacteria bacterium]|nr:MAG: hypothetical protein DSY90_04405 [Deltaproteobacteria bacterium]